MKDLGLPLIVVVVSCLISASPRAGAQEVCGLQGVTYNNMFRNGFEANTPGSAVQKTDQTELLGLWNFDKPIAIAPIPSGGSPAITITEPASSGPIPGHFVQLRGTVSGPINTGVSVNGIPAHVQNNEFVTPILTLSESGPTTFTATATTLDGATASVGQIHDSVAANGVRLTANKTAEFPNRPVRFSLTVDPALAIQQITVDFDGDGTPEFTGANPLLLPATYTYSQPGIYTAEARVTTASAGVLTSTQTHVAVDVVELRIRACSVYGALRTRLTANDVAAAILVFPGEHRPLYEATFNALGTNRPVYAGRLGTIATGLLTPLSASLTVITTDEAPPQAYRIRVVQASDGVWRIEEM